ncbi:MAG: endonuclease/exonuclease/phosphatase family protein [Planctomycetota bacterium]
MNQHEEVSARLRCFTPTGIARILFGSTLIGILAILPLSASFSAFWPADLIANISSQLMLLAFVLSIACFVIRSWRFGSAGILITIALYFALPMSPRAERVHVDEATNTLKILHFNVLSWNKQTEDVIAMIKDSQADVVSLVETSDALLSRIRDDAELKNIYPYRHLPDRAGAGFPLLLTHA